AGQMPLANVLAASQAGKSLVLLGDPQQLDQPQRGSHPEGADVSAFQQAPVVIYSMATSAPEDAPHAMEFLYSLNRLNVATSRARCACVVVANPRLFEPECETPRQMQLANGLCRYVELAQSICFDSDEAAHAESTEL